MKHCKVPFCLNYIKYTKSKYCSSHQIYIQSVGIKAYKELLPIWAVKRCHVHGLLRPSQTSKTLKNHFRCKACDKNHRQPKPNISLTALNNKKEKNLIRRYGIKQYEYNLILSLQNDSCAICRRHILNFDSGTGILRKMCVDHCHDSKMVRGILCFKCNVGLGNFEDNINFLEAAIKYLRPFKRARDT